MRHDPTTLGAARGGGRFGWVVRCRCGWFSPYIRETEARALRDHDDHVAATEGDDDGK